jgi:hypothetical protein
VVLAARIADRWYFHKKLKFQLYRGSVLRYTKSGIGRICPEQDGSSLMESNGDQEEICERRTKG